MSSPPSDELPVQRTSVTGPAENQSPQERERRQREEILRFVSALFEPAQVIELRALDYDPRNRWPQTASGYFDDREKLADAALHTSPVSRGTYVVMNEIDPPLLARRANELHTVSKSDPLTGDHEVVRRRWLFVDLDPVRPSGISSTDVEHQAALERARQIREALAAQGWPAPIMLDSGNGAALLYRVDLSPDDGDLVKRVLEALALRFSDGAVEIDKGVHNPARLVRVAGTLNRKGSHTTQRPHRFARIVELPERTVVVPEELLQELAANAPEREKSPLRAAAHNGTGGFDVERWIADNNLDVEGPESWNGGRIWKFRICPWDTSHTNGSAVVGQLSNGALFAKCHHHGCTGKGWHDLRDVVEPGWRDGTSRRNDEFSLFTDASTGAPSTPRRKPPEPYEPFPVETLPQPVARFVEEGAAAIGCDPAYVALPKLAAIAAAIGNSRTIRLKRGWSEPAILWATLVGESGTHKSPALDLALKPVRDVQEEKLRAYKKALEEHEAARLRYEKELSAWKKSKGDSDPPENPERPIAQRLTISDITIEACALLLQDAPRGLLLARDELSSWVGSFDAFKQGKSDAAHWCELHRGGTLIVDRKTGDHRIIFVPRASVSLTGGIQPRIMRMALGDEHRENGLLARLLLCMPPRKARQWTEAEVDPELALAIRGVFERLWGIPLDKDAEGEPRPRAIPLTPEGKRAFIRFVNEHGEEQVKLEGDLAAAWSKIEGYAARLALVLHLTRWAGGDPAANPDAVDEASVTAGVTLARWFCREARRVYATLMEDDEARRARQILERVERLGGRATPYELHRSDCTLFPDSEDAEQVLQELVRRGLGQWEAVPPGPEGGRPTRRFIAGAPVKTPLDPQENWGFRLSPEAEVPQREPGEEVEWTG